MGGDAVRLMIHLRDDESSALLAWANEERRDARAQAALAVRQALERRGLLPAPPKGEQESPQEARCA